MKSRHIRLAIEAALVLVCAVFLWRAWQPAEEDAESTQERTSTNPARVTDFIQERQPHSPRPTAASGEERRSRSVVKPAAPEVEPQLPPPILGGEIVDVNGELMQEEVTLFSRDGGFSMTVDKGVFRYQAPEGRFHLQAQYRDGLLVRQSEEFLVECLPGEETQVRLVLPGHSLGGPGFSFVHRGEFIEVTEIQEGSAAAAAGLSPGALLIEVEGRSVQERSAADIEAELQGAPGSVVEVLLVTETEQGDVVEIRLPLERALLPRP